MNKNEIKYKNDRKIDLFGNRGGVKRDGFKQSDIDYALPNFISQRLRTASLSFSLIDSGSSSR
jgi:hypothetical protein